MEKNSKASTLYLFPNQTVNKEKMSKKLENDLNQTEHN
jgi:hypothetical protein